MTPRPSVSPTRLFDPDWEPGDEELKALGERAWTSAAPAHDDAARALERQLAIEAEEAKRRHED